VQIPAIWWAAHWGLRGVAWMNLVVTFVLVVPMYLALVRPMISGRIHEVFMTSGVPAVAGILAAVGAVLAASWPSSSWAALALGSLVGGVVYLALTARWVRGALARARKLRDMPGWQVEA